MTALAVITENVRLPYNPALEAQFGVDVGRWRALTDAIYPAARTSEAIELALAYCKGRSLDIMKRPVHIVPVWSTALGRMVESVWPGIAELRTTAMRTGAYAGCAKTEFGPDVELTFKGGFKMSVPAWAQKTVYRALPGAGIVAFEGPEVAWVETYATAERNSDVPNAMWKKRPRGQLDKCAEAAALRCAFPEEIGNEYAAEEMAGRVVGPDGAPLPTEAAPRQVRVLHAGFADDDAAKPAAEAAQADEVIEAEVEEAPGETPVTDALVEQYGGTEDIVAWATTLNRDLPVLASVDVIRTRWDMGKDRLKAENPGLWRELNRAVAARAQEIANGSVM